jgi:type IV pilus assembly protein PilM
VTMPEDKIFLRILEIPKMQENEMAESIKWEIEENLPVALDKIYYDWQIVEEGSKHSKVLVVASVRTMVDDLLEILESMGFNVCAIEADSLANARSILPKSEKRPVLFIDMGLEGTSYFIYEGGYPVFSSSSGISGKRFTDLIVKKFGLSWEKAESYKMLRGLGRNQEERREMIEIFEPILSSLVEEVDKTIHFYNDNLAGKNKKLKKVMLCGGSTNLKGLVTYLEIKLKDFEVSQGNPWENTRFTRELPPISKEEAQSYVTAIGLALRSVKDE